MSRPPPEGYRNMSNGSNPAPASSSMGASAQPRAPTHANQSSISRAERFEDEKRRIIESCFTKQDQNGQLSESYITHIRIQEDSLYPSSPPPPESQNESKKPRIIIIAVRSTGRVRLHKARENANGSFSIGKTWNMEELSVIESYTATSPPQSEKEAQYRSWAGATGFTVTLTKPYYWQAGTAKEKEFFIASAVKIYKKYTRGQVPELRGFDDQQLGMVLGNPPVQQGRPPMNGSRAPSGSDAPAPPQPPFAARPQSRDNSRYRESPGPPPSVSDRDGRTSSAPGSRAASESHSPARFNEANVGRPPKPFASNEQLRSQSSREAVRPDPRSGSSPGPGGYRPSPPPLDQMPPPPIMQPGRTQSPAAKSAQPARDRPQSPLTSERGREGPQPTMNSTNGASGAELFASSRRRLAEHQYQDTSAAPSPAAPRFPISPETQRTRTATTDRQATPTDDRKPFRQDSEGMDPTDAAAFGMLSSFEPPPHAVATPPLPQTPPVPEPASPPTPERSRFRPPLDTNISSSSADLRPAPLNARARPTERSVPPAIKTNGAAKTEQSAPAQPLSPTPNKADMTLQMPGALPVTPEVQTPASTSAAPSLAETEATQTDSAQEPQPDEEEYRPGLGPMIRKKAVADRFKKAANAANAFKPRPGGAAEKILKAKAERDANGRAVEPDGISSVVPRPMMKQEASKEEVTTTKELNDLPVKQQDTPDLRISSPVSPISPTQIMDLSGMDGASRGIELQDEAPPRLSTPDRQQEHLEAMEREQAEQLAAKQRQLKIKRRSAHHLRYLEELGINSSMLADKSIGFESMLYDFGWADSQLSSKALSNMEADLRREQAKLEAGSWLSSPGQDTISAKDERERQVYNLLDKAIQECDEMDGLLTIYHVELSSLNDDVAFIEAQSQGLQVQSANQQLLHTELSNLLDTMGLDKRTLEPLRRADLSSPRSLEDAEGALVKLYQAMVTIDPSIRSANVGRRKSSNLVSESNELASMSALRQKREVYERESNAFCQRVMQHLDYTFTTLLNDAKARAMEPATSGAMKLRRETWAEARRSMWMYSPLILYAKELNPPAWQAMFTTYQTRAKPLYADAFRQNFASWKRTAKKPTGEEADILFTAQEKEEPATSGGALSSARKMTVKRSHTLARTLRSANTGDKHSPADTRNSGSLMPSEVFSGAVDEMAVLISQEQNFVVDLFHASTLEKADFIDVVMAVRPDERMGTNLLTPKLPEPDREVARRVTSAMDDIFSFFSSEVSSLLDWTISSDPIQGVGVMACLSRHAFFLHDSSQEYLMQLVEQLMVRLQNLFTKFIQDQVRAIEETKVKIKKRKGVIGFIKIFPHFSAAVENIFSAVAGADYDTEAACMADTRNAVDDAYAKLNRAMFDSLKIIAKESPTAVPHPTGAAAKTSADDPEDKEMLNYHILLIENMNHYVEEVDDGGKEGVLAEWKGKALMERAEALEGYVSRVMRRPLGKLLDFLDALDSVRESHQHNPAAITARPNYSRKAARNVLAQYDGKELRRGIDTLRKRIEKHFGDADDEAISRALVNFVCKDCERAYERTITRCEDMIRELYPPMEGEKPVELDFSKADVQAGFRR